MATYNFTANDAYVTVNSTHPGASIASIPDPVARAAIEEYQANGTTSGTITVSVD